VAVTVDDVRLELQADEPDYDTLAAQWGSEVVPFLAVLAKNADPLIGPRAVYLAGKIADHGAATIVADATKSPDPLWRLAAAGTAENLADEERMKIVSKLLQDNDAGVRKLALESTPNKVDRPLEGLLNQTAKTDPVGALRNLAKDVIARINRE
jgi:HEAT repeat protein